MLAMWGIALAIVIIQSDLGAALLYFLVFLGLLYVATRRTSYVVLGMGLFLAGGFVLYELVPRVQERIDIWLNPWADAQGAGYQVIRGLYAYGRGGILGTGIGAGLPQVGTIPSIPAIHTDFIFAGIAEELGMLGALAVLGMYIVIAERGFRIAALAADDFRALLATGLTLVIVVQAAIIAGGNLRVVPLTGITLPLVSYGGSSLLVNGAVIGLLLALSDKGVEPPVPGARRSNRRAVRPPSAFARRPRGVGAVMTEPNEVQQPMGRAPKRRSTRSTSSDARSAKCPFAARQRGSMPNVALPRPKGTAAHRRQPVAPFAGAGPRYGTLAGGLMYWQVMQARDSDDRPAQPDRAGRGARRPARHDLRRGRPGARGQRAGQPAPARVPERGAAPVVGYRSSDLSARPGSRRPTTRS